MQRQAEEDREWEHVSRNAHWRTALEQLEYLNKQNVNQIKHIVSEGYY